MAIGMGSSSQSGEIAGSLSGRVRPKKNNYDLDEQGEPKDYMKNWKKRTAEQKASLPYSKRQKFEIAREDENTPVVGSFGLGISGYANEAKKAANNIGAKSSKHIVFDESASTPVSKPDASRRKSVTFTPDTKLEDGFSASKIGKLYLPPKTEISQLQTVEESALQQPEHDEPPKPQVPEKKKRKQKKNSKQQQQPHSASESTSSFTASPKQASTLSQPKNKENPPYLQYLQQYRDDRPNWKFNTTKQKLLLKNALNIFRIPLSYNSTLLEYIAGLQSTSFRKDLAKQADEGLQSFYIAHRGPGDSELPSMDSLAARRSAYQACLERAKEEHRQRGGVNSEAEDKQLAQLRYETERGERLESILFGALMVELHPELVQASQSNSAPSITDSKPSSDESLSVPAKRKRKARTEVSSDEDSSSSSSSSSGSDSESDDESDSPTPPKKKSKRPPKPVISAELLDRVFGKKEGDAQPSSGEDEATTSEVDTSEAEESTDNDDESGSGSDGEDSE